MSREELHELAQAATPQSVDIPASWPGLLVWAFGKWGPWVVFPIMLYPLYNDLKASNQQFVDITKANVLVLSAMAKQIEANGDKTQSLTTLVERIEAELKLKQ